MPRIARDNINSKYIHVITQGIRKEYIFEEDEYKKEYIKLLYKIVKLFKYTKILAYCVMDNHTHLLIYTDEIKELSKLMSRVNTTYGIYYNKNKDRVGYVFRNRYYTQEIKDEKHLYNTLAYIHHNPVKAKMVEKEEEYKYSSYNRYVKNNMDMEIIKLIFSSEEYLKQFYYLHKNFSEDNILEIREEQKTAKETIEKVVKEFCSQYNYNLDIIKKDDFLLRLLIEKIKNNCNTTNRFISECIGLGKNRITNLIKNAKNKD